MSGTIWGKDLSLISDRIIKKGKFCVIIKREQATFIQNLYSCWDYPWRISFYDDGVSDGPCGLFARMENKSTPKAMKTPETILYVCIESMTIDISCCYIRYVV